jgi:hypothetical protein
VREKERGGTRRSCTSKDTGVTEPIEAGTRGQQGKERRGEERRGTHLRGLCRCHQGHHNVVRNHACQHNLVTCVRAQADQTVVSDLSGKWGRKGGGTRGEERCKGASPTWIRTMCTLKKQPWNMMLATKQAPTPAPLPQEHTVPSLHGTRAARHTKHTACAPYLIRRRGHQRAQHRRHALLHTPQTTLDVEGQVAEQAGTHTVQHGSVLRVLGLQAGNHGAHHPARSTCCAHEGCDHKNTKSHTEVAAIRPNGLGCTDTLTHPHTWLWYTQPGNVMTEHTTPTPLMPQ